MFWKLFGRHDQKDIEGIESALHKMRKPLFDARKKEAVKAHLLSAIKNQKTQIAPVSMAVLEEQVKSAGLSVRLAGYMKAMIKERIFSEIEKTVDMFWLFKTKFIFKKVATYALVAIIMVTGVFSFITRPEAAFAHPTSVLREIEGDVVVLRAGQTLVAQEDFVLYQNDIIDTRDGTATIKYFDNSVSRLNKNTKITLSKLFSDDKALITKIELNFDSGEAWSMVFDLFNDSFFSVRGNEFEANVVDRATFSVSASQDKTEIGVFQNLIDLTTKTNGYSEKSVVLKGYKAVVEQGKRSKPQITRVTDRGMPFDQREWFEKNMKKDKEYIARVVQEQSSAHLAASAPDTLEESLYLPLSEIEKLRVKLNIAEGKFISGEALLNDGKIDEARKNFSAMKSAITDIKAKADELKQTDPESSEKLMVLANEKILKYKKALSIVTPNLPLYEAKQTLRDIELLVADDDYKKARVTLDSVSSMLLETQDMADYNRYENVKENLLESQKLLESLQNIDLSKDPELLKQVVEKKSDIVKMLTLIENTAKSPEIKKELQDAKNTSIDAIMDTVSSARDPQSQQAIESVVKDINNFMQAYPDEEGGTVLPKIQLFLDRTRNSAPDSELSSQGEN
ncbi:FecR domain-containing protein [Candidatus Peregrinibacteria bacterium]|nr:FecR domain-containing protein [Candidatus Peregrinibacteria bacterium]